MKDQKYYQKEREAIFSDSIRKELLRELFELYATSKPLIFKVNDNEIRCFYSDEVEDLAEKIKHQITLRDNQIFQEFNNQKTKKQ